MLKKLKSKKGIIVIVVLLLIAIGACSNEEVDDSLRKELYQNEETVLQKKYIDLTEREREIFDVLEKGDGLSESLKKDIKKDVDRLAEEKEVVLKEEQAKKSKEREEALKKERKEEKPPAKTNKKEKPKEAKKEQPKPKEEKAPSNNYKLKFGELVNVVINDDVAIFKAKITPSYNNKATINQNGFNIEDLVKEQGADKFKEIQYWAVAEMTDGSESKVISFTVNSNTIKSIKDGRIVGNKVIDHVDDLWLLPSLRD